MKFLLRFVLLAAVGFATAAVACDGPDPGALDRRYARANFVAVVRVTSLALSEHAGRVEGQAKVLQVVKGRPADSIAVAGFAPGVNCWKPLDVGRDYVVFLLDPSGNETAWFGMFTTALPEADVPAELRRAWRIGR